MWPSASGLEGDRQADKRVHGGDAKAVYAYAREDYEWWEAELGRELAPGTFGENLTLEGVDVSGAPAGERWRVGAALLEVTEPRLPCFKLGVKMDEPRFLKRFAGPAGRAPTCASRGGRARAPATRCASTSHRPRSRDVVAAGDPGG